VLPWLLSAPDLAGLRRRAIRLSSYVDSQVNVDPDDLATTLAAGPDHGEHRGAVLAGDLAGYREGLAALAAGRGGPAVIARRAAADRRVAFLFSGEGAQRLGMGRQLYEAFEPFASAFDEVAESLDRHSNWSVRDLVFASGGASNAELLRRSLYTQDALFAVQLALFRLLEAWGLRPDFVMGHSIGEMAAATVSGVFTLEDAAMLMAARVRAINRVPAGGAMVAVQVSEAEAMALLAGRSDRVAVAVVNGPSSVVLSGAAADVREIAAQVVADGRKIKELPVTHAFHSPDMDGALEHFGESIARLRYAPPAIPIVSNLTGRPVSAEEVCGPAYWVRQVREPSRFYDCVRWLSNEGVDTFVEIGADGVLAAMTGSCLAEPAAGTALVVPTLRGDRDEVESVLRTMAELHAHGVAVDWSAVFAGRGGRPMELPEDEPVDLPEADTDEADPALIDRVRAATGLRLRHILLEVVVAEAAAALGHPLRNADAQRSFVELGFTSLAAVEFIRGINTATGLRVPTPAVFDHPGLRSFAEWLGHELRREPISSIVDDRGADAASAQRAALVDELAALTDEEIFARIDNYLCVQ
jgi:acyl transferase domain-containing protein